MKKTISVLLAVLMLLTVIPFGASAAEDTGSNVRFIVEDNCLWAIDFSGMIRDLATVNKGEIDLVLANEQDAVCEKIEIDENGKAAFFDEYEDGTKDEVCIRLSLYDYQFEIRPAEGNLFDDVQTYSFSVKDVYESMGDVKMFITDYPSAEITKQDGDLVKEITLSFVYSDDPLLPITVDMKKELKLTVLILETIRVDFCLKPVAYDNGKLTVSVLDSKGNEGVALHDARITANDTFRSTVQFFLYVPEGMFRIDGTGVVSEEIDDTIWIEGLPVKDIINVKISNYLLKIIEPIYSRLPAGPVQKLMIFAMISVVAPFAIVRMVRGVMNSLSAYGISLRDLLGFVQSRSVKDTLSDFMRWFMEK